MQTETTDDSGHTQRALGEALGAHRAAVAESLATAVRRWVPSRARYARFHHHRGELALDEVYDAAGAVISQEAEDLVLTTVETPAAEVEVALQVAEIFGPSLIVLPDAPGVDDDTQTILADLDSLPRAPRTS